MRMTIPRSQGKQAYYDARKSSWGDIFPHRPKNTPQVRVSARIDGVNTSELPGADIGKRQLKAQNKQQNTDYHLMFSKPLQKQASNANNPI